MIQNQRGSLVAALGSDDASHDEELPQSIVFVARQVSLFLILAQEPFGRQVLSGGQALSIWRCFLNRMKFR